MAFPLIGAAIPALAKAGAFAKVMLGGKKALAAAKAAKFLTRPQLAGALKGKRFAGALIGNNPAEIAMRVGPDIGFGIMGGAMTPGDIGDKLIAGAAQAGGGLVGGIGAAGVTRKLGGGKMAQLAADQIGSVAGDFASMPVADAALKIKGGGTSSYEKQAMEQDAIYRAQIEQELMQKYGLV